MALLYVVIANNDRKSTNLDSDCKRGGAQREIESTENDPRSCLLVLGGIFIWG